MSVMCYPQRLRPIIPAVLSIILTAKCGASGVFSNQIVNGTLLNADFGTTSISLAQSNENSVLAPKTTNVASLVTAHNTTNNLLDSKSSLLPTDNTKPKSVQAIDTPFKDLLVQAFSAFIGAGAAFGFAIWIWRRQRMDQMTAAMVNEFSSREMLKSRFVTVNVEKQIIEGKLTLRQVALSMVRDCPPGFSGVEIDGLTEHQHISLLVGWMRRLAVHLQEGWVDRRVITATLGGSFQWTLPLLLKLADETEKIMDEHPSTRSRELRASWIYAVRTLNDQFEKAKPHHRIPGAHFKTRTIPPLSLDVDTKPLKQASTTEPATLSKAEPRC